MLIIAIILTVSLILSISTFLLLKRSKITYNLTKDYKLLAKHVNYNSSSLYNCFLSETTYNFVKSYAFVNAKFIREPDGSLTVIFKGYDSIHYRYNIKWEDIKCDTHLDNDNIKIIPCSHKRPSERYNETQKIFWYKKADNLKDYIEKLHSKKISKVEHQIYFDLILEGFRDDKTFINHNTDVKFLHVKLRS